MDRYGIGLRISRILQSRYFAADLVAAITEPRAEKLGELRYNILQG